MKQISLKVLFLTFLATAHLTVFGQEKPVKDKPLQEPIIHKSYANDQGIIRCHTMEVDSIRRANNPSLPSLMEDELWIQEKVAEIKAQMAAGTYKKTVVTIPIVFHIFTSGGAAATNLPAAVVQHQVDQLNLDYRNLAGSPFAVAADAEIEFCLAVIDPSGNSMAEPGIDRITSYGNGPFSQTQFESSMKAATVWNPDNYFNVWVCNLSGGLLGYAQFPTGSGLAGLSGTSTANTDGCVILYSSLGSVANPQGAASGAYNKGRTLTHESGHWLGLRHIWGDGACSVDDYCADTPKSDASNFGCPNTNSCTDAYTSSSPWWPTANPPDMVENFMDYSDDGCMNTFTADQKLRFLAVITNSPRRASLTVSTVCAVPNPDDAGIANIATPNGTICSSSFDPSVTLNNYGNNTITTVNIVYNIDGGANQTYTWTGSLASGGQTTVTLPTMTPSTGPHTFNVWTESPNGNTDSNTANDSDASSFTIVVGGQAVTLTLSTDCWGEETYWELLDASSNVVTFGGNTTGIPPGGGQIGVAQGDPGAYTSETTITDTWCLASGCYDFVIYDDYGDGMYGSQWSGCTTDGTYSITDGGGTVLAQMQAANGDFGNSETSNFCIAPPCNSTFTSSVVEELCYGDNNAQITVSFVTGNAAGATFDIGSGTQSSGMFSGLAQGTYTVTIVDGDNCTSIQQITVGGPSQLNPSSSVVNISCSGQVDGVFTVTGNNTGTAPYTYDIGAGPVTSGTFTGLAAGSYTVTVTDANGCTATANGTVVEPTVLNATVGTITPEYFGNDGSVSLNVTGGTPSYTYAWTGTGGYTSTSANPGNMPGGTYSVTITDSKGCTTTISNIVVPSEMGIDENGNIKFVIYPNPSNGVFNVQVMNGENVVKAKVTDVAGRLVYEVVPMNNTFTVDLENSANGTYMLTIQTDSQTYVKRIVLKK